MRSGLCMCACVWPEEECATFVWRRGHEEIPSHRLKRCSMGRQCGWPRLLLLLYVLSNINPPHPPVHVLFYPWGVWVLFLGHAFFHYCIGTLEVHSQVVRRERGLPHVRAPKSRLCYWALLHNRRLGYSWHMVLRGHDGISQDNTYFRFEFKEAKGQDRACVLRL